MKLMFNPVQSYMLYASFRRHETIYAWDLRGDVSRPLYAFGEEDMASAMRAVDTTRTNQKLKFDLDIAGNVLGVGDQVGRICSAGRHLSRGIIARKRVDFRSNPWGSGCRYLRFGIRSS